MWKGRKGEESAAVGCCTLIPARAIIMTQHRKSDRKKKKEGKEEEKRRGQRAHLSGPSQFVSNFEGLLLYFNCLIGWRSRRERGGRGKKRGYAAYTALFHFLRPR